MAAANRKNASVVVAVFFLLFLNWANFKNYLWTSWDAVIAIGLEMYIMYLDSVYREFLHILRESALYQHFQYTLL